KVMERLELAARGGRLCIGSPRSRVRARRRGLEHQHRREQEEHPPKATASAAFPQSVDSARDKRSSRSVLRFPFPQPGGPVSTARAAGLASLCVLAAAIIVVPAVRAQRTTPPAIESRDARTVAQRKISPRVLSAIYRRRGDLQGKAIAKDPS